MPTDTITAELQARVWAAATDSEPWQGYREKCPHNVHTWGHHLSHWHYCTGNVRKKKRGAYPVGITKMHDVKCVPALTSWDGCGQLLEAMRAKGWSLEIRFVPDMKPAAFFIIYTQYKPGGYSTYYKPHEAEAEADTLPEAVLLAAAKALGVSDA